MRARTRLCMRHEQTEEGVQHQVVLKDEYGNVLEESPKGSQAEAERYRWNYERFGAWKLS